MEDFSTAALSTLASHINDIEAVVEAVAVGVDEYRTGALLRLIVEVY